LITSITVAAFFIGPLCASADTVYQQLVDSGGKKSLPFSTSCANSYVVGTVVTDGASHVMNGGTGYFYFNNPDSSSNTVDIGLSTTSSYCDEVGAAAFSIPPTGSDGTVGIDGAFSGSSLAPNTHYNLVAISGSYAVTVKIVSSFDTSNAFGYITDANQNNVPIIPGVPGFTDVGVATSSVASYCNSSFSATTTFASQLSSDFSYGLCTVSVFLFVPPASALTQYGNFSSLLSGKFPFSYFYSIAGAFSSLTASTTENLPTFTLNLQDLGIGSSTSMGNILPNFVLLSTSTIGHFMPDSIRLQLLFLATCAMWLAFMYDVFRTIKNQTV